MIKKSYKKKIDKCDIVSFDIFDTVLKRKISKPSRIFRLMDNIYGNDFYKKRMTSESLAMDKYNKKSPNIEEIYNFIDLDYKIELDVESNYLFCNSCMKEVYDYCVQSNKKVVFVSDMYLPGKVLEELLKRNGYNYFEKVYSSCDYDKSKRDGTLFDLVIDELNTSPGKIVHIGDSIKSDYINPKKKGMRSILCKPKTIEYDNLSYDIYDSFIKNTIKDNNNYYYSIGFDKFGILLYSYSIWLKKQLEDKKISKVYFLSRDGYLIKQAFDIINDNSKINSKYLYVSRRSLNIPNLWKKPEFENLDKNINMSNYFNIEVFIKRLGLNYKDYLDLIEKHNISLEHDFNKKTFKNERNLKDFYNEIINDVIENSKKEYKLLKDYFKQEDINGDIAIVDIGWHGSMQKNIVKICEDISNRINVYGYYLGQEEKVPNGLGYLFNEFDNPTNKITIAGSFGLFESFFLANHGTVLTYEKKNNKIVPVLDKYEFDDCETNIIKDIQKGAIDFCTLFSQNKYNNMFSFDDISFKPLERLLSSPTLKEVKELKNIMFNDTDNVRLINSKSLLYYLLHLKKLKNDFFKCTWKLGFIKDVFKIKFPYYRFYYKLKIKEKNSK